MKSGRRLPRGWSFPRVGFSGPSVEGSKRSKPQPEFLNIQHWKELGFGIAGTAKGHFWLGNGGGKEPADHCAIASVAFFFSRRSRRGFGLALSGWLNKFLGVLLG